MIATVGTLTFRTIDPARDARLAFAHQLDACVATYGDAKRCQAPEFRGRGYGDRLNESAERYFRSWEAGRVELHVSPINERAVRFYLRHGYTFSEPRDRGEALRLMSKVL